MASRGEGVHQGVAEVSPDSKDAIRKVALRVAKEPMRASLDDVRKLARGVLMLVDGRLPRRA